MLASNNKKETGGARVGQARSSVDNLGALLRSRDDQDFGSESVEGAIQNVPGVHTSLELGSKGYGCSGFLGLSQFIY